MKVVWQFSFLITGNSKLLKNYNLQTIKTEMRYVKYIYEMKFTILLGTFATCKIIE